MTYSNAKKTALTTGIAGTLFATMFMIATAQAQDTSCTVEIEAIDKTLQSTALETETLAKVTQLRQTAIARNSQGDVEGCMQDVASIKSLLGL